MAATWRARARDKTIRIWEAASGKAIGEPFSGHSVEVSSVVWSPDGRRLASASRDETIRIWDMASGKQVGEALSGHTGWVDSVAWSPDGTRLASASFDETLPDLGRRHRPAVGRGPLRRFDSGRQSGLESGWQTPGKRVQKGEDPDLGCGQRQIGGRAPLLQFRHRRGLEPGRHPPGQRVRSGTIQIWEAASGNLVGEALSGDSARLGDQSCLEPGWLPLRPSRLTTRGSGSGSRATRPMYPESPLELSIYLRENWARIVPRGTHDPVAWSLATGCLRNALSHRSICVLGSIASRPGRGEL